MRGQAQFIIIGIIAVAILAFGGIFLGSLGDFLSLVLENLYTLIPAVLAISFIGAYVYIVVKRKETFGKAVKYGVFLSVGIIVIMVVLPYIFALGGSIIPEPKDYCTARVNVVIFNPFEYSVPPRLESIDVASFVSQDGKTLSLLGKQLSILPSGVDVYVRAICNGNTVSTNSASMMVFGGQTGTISLNLNNLEEGVTCTFYAYGKSGTHTLDSVTVVERVNC